MSEHGSKWQIRSTPAGVFLMERRSGWKSPDYFTDVARFENPNDARLVLAALRRDEGVAMTVEQLRQLEQAAIEGPWAKDAPMMSQTDERYVGMRPLGDGYRYVMAAPDAATAELIAAMRNSLPVLLDIAEAAQEVTSPDYMTAPGPYAEGVRLDAMRDLMAALSRLDTEGGT